MTSERKAGDRQGTRVPPREAYVWIWLPGSMEPVVAGRLARDGDLHVFNYGRSYLERPDAIPIFLPELPLQRGVLVPPPPLDLAGALRDGSPALKLTGRSAPDHPWVPRALRPLAGVGGAHI
ncbi:hypothetical protein [Phaeospirillum tilakii]|uniref:HipA N-terminal domain-containing protein n=1 Tax=Phaeospirillum tilakii TaxID=741673 RepID=A0ABW5C916_9PROT